MSTCFYVIVFKRKTDNTLPMEHVALMTFAEVRDKLATAKRNPDVYRVVVAKVVRDTWDPVSEHHTIYRKTKTN